jgi:hypothetical protein
MFRDEIGAPSGSWKYRTCPSMRVTVTVQSAAEDEAGSAATPSTAADTPSVATATLSFTRLNTVLALFLKDDSHALL